MRCGVPPINWPDFMTRITALVKSRRVFPVGGGQGVFPVCTLMDLDLSFSPCGICVN